MATRINCGDSMSYTPGSAVSAGDVVVVGEVVAIADADIASGELGALSLEGVYNVVLLGADDVSAGDKLYWDAGNSRATLTASTHKVIGYAVEDATTGVEDVNVKLSIA